MCGVMGGSCVWCLDDSCVGCHGWLVCGGVMGGSCVFVFWLIRVCGALGDSCVMVVVIG